MVDLALSSMALAVYSRTQRYPAAAVEASSKYHRLLRITQGQIAQVGNTALDEGNIDAYLLAIFLMSRYESTVYDPNDSNSKDWLASLPSWSHHDGAIAMLKMWNDTPNHRPATFIIKQNRRGLIKSFLLRGLPVPDWMQSGSCFGERGSELVLDSILVRTVNLHYASISLLSNDSHVSRAKGLSNEARDLDEALQNWAHQLPSTWSYQQHKITNAEFQSRKGFYSSKVYSYSKTQYAGVWSNYFAMRMLINNAHLRILNLKGLDLFVSPTYEQQRSKCIIKLKAMADNLASTVPFCLERFKVLDNLDSTIPLTSGMVNNNAETKPYLAGSVTWPVTIASSLQGIDADQKLWFKSELAGLGRITGTGIFECAESTNWRIL